MAEDTWGGPGWTDSHTEYSANAKIISLMSMEDDIENTCSSKASVMFHFGEKKDSLLLHKKCNKAYVCSERPTG